MADLQLQLSDFAAEVGSGLGFQRIPGNWTGWQPAIPYEPASPQTHMAYIRQAIDQGMRQFYYPRLADDGPVAYKWSFLTPERQLNVISGTTTYDLPQDYDGLDGEMTYDASVGTYRTIRRIGIGEMKRMLQQSFGTTNKPIAVSIVPKPSDGTGPQQFQAIFYPIPDASYTLTYRSNIRPPRLDYLHPYPYGGPAHGECILESMLAVVEMRVNGESGLHSERFKDLLQASISFDSRESKPEFLGRNLDRSDSHNNVWWGDAYATQAALHNGTFPWSM